MSKTEVVLDKPLFVAGVILDMAKNHMVSSFFRVILPAFHRPPSSTLRMMTTDTDSFVFVTQYHDDTVDPYRALGDCASILDTSVYDVKTHRYFQKNQDRIDEIMAHRETNAARLGCFKDELGNDTIRSIVCLLPKLYSFDYFVENHDDVSVGSKQKCKGIARSTVKNEITHDDYSDTVADTRPRRFNMRLIQSKNHSLYLLELQKVGLSLFDSKMWWPSRYHSLPFCHPKAVHHGSE